jgi:ArsR family transcriptional regulator, arsenate/arsenite/antimonite-responsive transcriptional repressor / arsenate reductase (thioredoxin)
MENADAVIALAALAQDNRLDVFRLLVQAGPAGLPAGQVAAALDLAPNTLTFHFDRLRSAGLVTVRREGRSMIYAARFETMNALLAYLTENCCNGAPESCRPAPCSPGRASKPPPVTAYNVLFLCTGNSARSIIAEAILDKLGAGKFRAFSAGSQPKGKVNPRTLQLLEGLGYDISGFRSKSWDEFAKADGPAFDFVFTVCDNAAAEACPLWPGQPLTAHWGIPDPAAATGTEAEIALAFKDAYRMLHRRIGLFVSLPIRSLDRLGLQHRLKEIGRMEGATRAAEPA